MMNQLNGNIKLPSVIGRILAMFVLLCGSMLSFSQTTNYYYCDFEDPNENSKWLLNMGEYAQDSKNQWVIDTAVNNGGKYSLYISHDSGKTAAYLNSNSVMAAYRTIESLPVGRYELTFDWQAGKNPKNALYVCWIPHSLSGDTVAIYSADAEELFPWVKSNTIKYPRVGDTPVDTLTSSTWTTISTTVEVKPGVPKYKLVFVWNNGTKQPLNQNPGACVDNISIVQEGACDKPTDLGISAVGDRLTFSWKGTADSYDIRYCHLSSSEMLESSGITEKSITVNGIGEGMYELYVRSNCGDLHSRWVSVSKFIYYKGMGCVDYLDLTAQNCFTSVIGAVGPDKPGAVDYGPSSKFSRHTIHYDKSEVDSRTIGPNGSLKTIPDDAIASVRLGNWDVNAQKESIFYRYHVDASTSAVLLLKYAVVLEDPGHIPDNQPRFTLAINDKEQITIGCGSANFRAGDDNTSDETWHTAPGETPESIIRWKEWTTVGINLKDYDGEDVTIRLTTYDCSEKKHYGYAYFSLACSDGRLVSLSCGDDEAESKFEAPEGFVYEWYKKDEPWDILEIGRVFDIEQNDTALYECKVKQPTNLNCFYILQAQAMNRWPISEASYQPKSKDCLNVVEFTNESYIRLVNPISKDTTISDERCETVYWDFGDGSPISNDWSPAHVFPSEGGSYKVTLSTGLANDKCSSMDTFTVTLPNIVSTPDTVREYACYDVPFTWENGEVYEDEGIYSDTVVDPITGCRHISVLVLKFRDEMIGERNDTVCTNDLPYIFNGKEYMTTGQYIDTLIGPHGCDSIVTINLLVNTSLNLNFDTEIQACADDDVIYIPYEVESGFVTSYDVIFNDDAVSEMGVTNVVPTDLRIELTIPEDIRPDNYKAQIIFENLDCGDVVREVNFHILYPDSIIVQRWNDVLGVRNHEYNGGYDFASFQWYKDGDVLVGQTSSNLYVPEGLDVEAQYTVLITRGDDGHSVFTCPKTPVTIPDVTNVPTIAFNSNDVYVKSEVDCVMRIWSATGVLVGVYDILPGDVILPAPRPAGVYILEMETKNGDRMIEKIITGY